MQIKDYPGGKVITLSSALDSRGKILFVIYFFVFTSLAYAITNFALDNTSNNTIAVLVVLAICGIYFLIGQRFLNKALESEKLVVTKDNLSIVTKRFLSKKEQVFKISSIHNFRHLDKPQLTKHPLAGESVDYNGFQIQQQVINEMSGDNRVAFDYEGRTIKFGQNIYSWDFEEIENTVLTISGISISRHPENFYSEL